MRKTCVNMASLAAIGFLAACAADEGVSLNASESGAASDDAQMAETGFPSFNATCPAGPSVRADDGGPVFIDGQQAVLKKFSESLFEAKRGDVTISVNVGPGGAVAVAFMTRGGANGACEVL